MPSITCPEMWALKQGTAHQQNYSDCVSESIFEQISQILNKTPNLTAREIAAKVRGQGQAPFTSRLANQSLYRMLTAGLVVRDDNYIPRWRSTVDQREFQRSQPSSEQRPLTSTQSNMRHFRIAGTTVKVILDSSMSPNDQFIVPDWIGPYVVVTVNTAHPFWNVRVTTDSEKTLTMLFYAIDGYVSWRTAQLHEPPDATEQVKIRDEALRFCTLRETEIS